MPREDKPKRFLREKSVVHSGNYRIIARELDQVDDYLAKKEELRQRNLIDRKRGTDSYNLSEEIT